ncbi:Subtilase family protein [Auraticoccus monumenti]|uniref:Subtilase family protein n=1 Tax=Auraticoccus monumenti TaxID=675864 RepID=A0A1G6SKP7_9ACTN|nr:Subtilase family protein [Auraticoccus monumenti]
MGTRRRRSPRAVAVGVLAATLTLLSPAALPAAAVGDGEPFRSRDCKNFQANAPISSWAVDRLQPQRAHELATGRGVRIAVIDTGVDNRRMPVFGKASVSVVNYAGYEQKVDAGSDLRDCQHGTQVTSLIVGGPTDGTNFIGMAPGATVIAMRSLESGPAAPDQSTPQEPQPIAPVVEAVRAATAEEVDIINISQSSTYDADYADAVADAIDAGIVVVAAAGNGGGGAADPPYPAAFPGVVAVGATGPNDVAPDWSQSHEELRVTVSAPGVKVLSANPAIDGESSWSSVDGTSFAAPLVTGVVALMLEREPDLTPGQVTRRLRRTADPTPRTAPDRQTGWGVVNPLAAVTDVVSSETPAPGPVASPTPAEDYRDRPPVDHSQRDTALAVAGGAVAVVLVAAVLAASLPAGRRRRWAPPRD